MRLGLTISVIVAGGGSAAAGRGGADWLKEGVPVIDRFSGVVDRVSMADDVFVVAVSAKFAEEA